MTSQSFEFEVDEIPDAPVRQVASAPDEVEVTEDSVYEIKTAVLVDSGHLTCCDDEVSLCGLDIREAVEGPDCIVCEKYRKSQYHSCPLCGRFSL